MQACLGTNLHGSYQIKDMSYELMDQDENSYRTIHSALKSKLDGWNYNPSNTFIDTLRNHCMERPQER